MSAAGMAQYGPSLLDVLHLPSLEDATRLVLSPANCKQLRLVCSAARDWVDRGVRKLGIALREGTEEEELLVAWQLGQLSPALRPTSLKITGQKQISDNRTNGSSVLQHPALQPTLSQLAHVHFVRLPASQALMTGLVLLALPRLSRLELTDVPAEPQCWDCLHYLRGLRSLSVSFERLASVPALWDAVLAATQLTDVAVLQDHGPSAAQIASLAALPALRSLACT
jgi:hypothetical protein